MNPDLLVMLLRMATDMRTYMMTILTDDELSFRFPNNLTLGEQCREMGNVERTYINSIKTGKMDEWNPHAKTFTAEYDMSPAMAGSVEKLTQWYKALDDEFAAVLLAIPADQLDAKMVERGGRQMPVSMHYHTYHEAVLIFCAKCSIYLRTMGKPLNDQWLDWIG